MNYASENVKVSNDSLDYQFLEFEGVSLKQCQNFYDEPMITYVYLYLSQPAFLLLFYITNFK